MKLRFYKAEGLGTYFRDNRVKESLNQSINVDSK